MPLTPSSAQRSSSNAQWRKQLGRKMRARQVRTKDEDGEGCDHKADGPSCEVGQQDTDGRC